MKKTLMFTVLIAFLLIVTSSTLAAYTVRTGDTLWKISQKTGLSIEEILEKNNLNNPGSIYVGQKLKLSDDNASNDNNNVSYIRYKVKTGDLLWKIARNYDVSVQEIINLNNIKSPYYINIGQTIRIPGEEEKEEANTPAEKSYFYYTVKSGDILWNISQKYGTTVQELVKLNDIKNSYDLYAGRKLIVPLNENQPTDGSNDNDDNDDNNDNNNNENENNNRNNNYVPYSFYEIKEGDHIWTIADFFNIKTSTLIRYNNIETINEIQAGEVLIIPLRESNKFDYLKRTSKQLNNYYRVLRNESLTDIAEYYNIPEQGIRAINQLSSNEEVYTGQRLLMPVNPSLFRKHEIYRVKDGGEYIFDIAFENGISIKSILKANYLKNQNIKFNAGSVILVPLDQNSKATWIEYENGEPINSWF
ncbi:MAG: LysM peptidoglycan-binding domain-containing protein [Halanaerobiales bacterium]